MIKIVNEPNRVAGSGHPFKWRHRLQDIFPALALALVVRVLVLFIGLEDPERFFTLDAQQYMALARDLNGGYFDPGSALWNTGLIRTPGYPVFSGVFVALGAGSVVPVILAQIGLSLLAIVFTHALAARLVGALAARYAAMALAMDPATATYTCLLQPESLFTVLTLVSLLLWLRALESDDWRGAVMSGLVAGLAALCRPIGVFLPLPLLVVAATSRSAARVRLAVICLAAFGAPVGGWVARNAAYTGAPILSAIEGENLLNYRAAGAIAMEQGRNIDEVRVELSRELEKRVLPSANAAERSQAQSRLGVEVLAQHPSGALGSALAGVLRLTTGTGLTALSGVRGDPRPESIEGGLERSLQVIFTGLLGLWYLASGLGIRELWRARNHRPLVILGVFVLYFCLLSAGPEANTRFRVPIMPFIAVLAGLGLARLLARKNGSR